MVQRVSGTHCLFIGVGDNFVRELENYSFLIRAENSNTNALNLLGERGGPLHIVTGSSRDALKDIHAPYHHWR